MKRNIRLERHFPHRPERVWRALTDPQALAEWLMKNDFEPRVGHKFQFRDRPRGRWNGVTDCEVLACEPLRRLSYTFGSDHLHSVVTWTLVADGEGTRLVLEHDGFQGVFGVLLSVIMKRGWAKMLRAKLPQVLARVSEGGFVPAAAPGELAGRC
jgi:uncharacterized protein YndB with AHSA1/START domain